MSIIHSFFKILKLFQRTKTFKTVRNNRQILCRVNVICNILTSESLECIVKKVGCPLYISSTSVVLNIDTSENHHIQYYLISLGMALYMYMLLTRVVFFIGKRNSMPQVSSTGLCKGTLAQIQQGKVLI